MDNDTGVALFYVVAIPVFQRGRAGALAEPRSTPGWLNISHFVIRTQSADGLRVIFPHCRQ